MYNAMVYYDIYMICCQNWNEKLIIQYIMVCFEIWTSLYSEDFYNLQMFKKRFTLIICNVNINFKIKIIFKFELKLFFMLLYFMKCFAMINDNLVITYKIVCYTTCMSLNAMLCIDICCKRYYWTDCIPLQYVSVVHFLTQLQ